MENKQQYDLSEAIKKAYQAEPLKIDLGFAVTNKLFAKKKEAIDKWLQVLLYCIIISAALVGLYYLVSLASIDILLLFLLFAAGFLWISLRELNFYKVKALS